MWSAEIDIETVLSLVCTYWFSNSGGISLLTWSSTGRKSADVVVVVLPYPGGENGDCDSPAKSVPDASLLPANLPKSPSLSDISDGIK